MLNYKKSKQEDFSIYSVIHSMISTMRTGVERIVSRIPLLSRVWLILVVLIIVAVCIASYYFVNRYHAVSNDYQTARVSRGTLIVTVTGSGVVSASNTAPVTTGSSGVVQTLYVKDGDYMSSGDPIALIDLDMMGKQKEAQARASYQSAQTTLANAQASLFTLQSSMLTEWKSHYDLATNSTFQNADGTPNTDNRTLAEFHVSQDNWLAAEAKYKNQSGVVQQAQTALSSAWLAYTQSSPTIYAPISGTITGLSLQVGTVISQSASTTNSTSTKIANIRTVANPTVTINLTEIDVPRVAGGDKATITFDALEDKTYTGKVISIDTVGTTTTGVTTYPTVILLDTKPPDILPNMAASATIITDTAHDVLMVPSGSIVTDENGTYVRKLNNGVVVEAPVEVGLASDTNTEILSGLDEGDSVVTSIRERTSTTSNQGQSIFGTFGGGRASGGNFMRVR